jgi:hypothetical protein
LFDQILPAGRLMFIVSYTEQAYSWISLVVFLLKKAGED